MRRLHGHVEGEIIQPGRTASAELVETIPRGSGRRRVEPIEHHGPQCLPVSDHGREIHLAIDEQPLTPRFWRSEQALLDQPVKTDEQRIPSECREALVG